MIIADFARKDTLVAVARGHLKELRENEDANHDLIMNIQEHVRAVEEDWSELSFVILNNLVGAFKLKKIDLSCLFSDNPSSVLEVISEIAKNTVELDQVKVECYDQTAYRVDIRRLVEVLNFFKKIDRLSIKVFKLNVSYLQLLHALPVRSLSMTIDSDTITPFEVPSFIKSLTGVEELFIKFPSMNDPTSILVEAILANQTLKVSIFLF